ncbi:uncharacterized protein LOC127841994 isoform X1 [Dreissena polymorpha]|uniref:uncharacterized protein LOC127841994 isoform X1 n=1 Tax=Dreissena polymorpha TaxID=45954 RepID=UPI002263E9A3|nr:uncharacterized protein LOC127841994 isoform X1 [Dreissena polymorpha]
MISRRKFSHRGAQSAGAGVRAETTSTGAMLAGPYRSTSAQQPLPPPPPFAEKSTRNYRMSNKFSEHDNRNAFQNHGIYFGDGQTTRQLGRTLIDPQARLHTTDTNFLKHYGREVIDYDYHSTYQNTYKGRDTTEPPRYRRFHKSLPPAEPGTVPLTTTTTAWVPTNAPQYKTGTQVLAISQEPFLKHNPWKYSYHSKRNVYPPYDRRSEPVVDNMFNRYGAAFNQSSNFNSTGFSGFESLETTGCS